MAFSGHPIRNTEIRLLDPSINQMIPAIIRETTIQDANLWESSWLPAWKHYDLPQQKWTMAEHILKSLPNEEFSERKTLCLCVECGEIVQAMIALTYDDAGENAPDGRPIIYVEYLCYSPENDPVILKQTGNTRQTQGAPRILLASALALAQQAGVEGWVGLDAKQGASPVYESWGMKLGETRTHSDGENYDYFEAGPSVLWYILRTMPGSRAENDTDEANSLKPLARSFPVVPPSEQTN